MGVNIKTQKISFLTNLTDGQNGKSYSKEGKKSRGQLIKNFLLSDFESKFSNDQEYFNKILEEKDEYNPCNLFFGNLRTMDFHYMNFFSKEI